MVASRMVWRGLYPDPPERAVVLCADEKLQTRALERTQPSLPLKPGRAWWSLGTRFF